MRTINNFIIKIILSLILIGAMTCITASADSIPSVSIEPSSMPESGNLGPGDSFQVTVEVDSAETELKALELFLDYDSNALQFNGANYEDLLGSNILVISDNTPGTYSFAVSTIGKDSKIVNGTLLTLEFQVKADAEDNVYDLDLHDVNIANEIPSIIPELSINDGQVLVTRNSDFTLIKVISDSKSFVPGDNFQVTIKVISNVYPLGSIGLELNYDPSAINFKGITEEGLLGVNATVAPGSGDDGAGSIIYGINATEPINESISDNILTIDFEVSENASVGTYSLDLNNVVFRDKNNTVIPDTLAIDTIILVTNVTEPTNEEPVEEIPTDEQAEEEDNTTGINLQPGWNLISFPENIDEPSIDDVLRDFSEDVIDVVFYDDANSGMIIVPVEFEPLKGYWVHNNMSESFIVDETFLQPKIPSGPPSLRLYPGWNAIGHTSRVELPAEYALITIDNFYTEVRGPWIPAEEDYAYVGYNNKEGIIEGNEVGTDVFGMNTYEGVIGGE